MGGMSAMGGGGGSSYQSEAKASLSSSIGNSTFGDNIVGKGAGKGLDTKTILIIAIAAVVGLFIFRR